MISPFHTDANELMPAMSLLLFRFRLAVGAGQLQRWRVLDDSDEVEAC